MPGDPTARPSLRPLVRAFAWIGVVSFGGGRIAYFQDELVVRRRWLGNDEFLEAVALSQVLPGSTIANLAAYIGQRLGGWRGAALAVLCLTLPGAAMTLGLAWLYFAGMPPALSRPIGAGVSAAAVGLAIATLIRLRGGTRSAGGYAVAGLTFLLFGPLHWPIHWVLAVALPPALLLAWADRR
jgi:chromate transporter